jgi:hypothetical protein
MDKEIRARRQDDGHVRVEDSANRFLLTLSEREAAAVMALGLKERDEALGRWRSPDDPDFVVYPNPSGSLLRVIDEREPGICYCHYRDGEPEEKSTPASYQQAARAYVEAHSRPWKDAKAGEVWVVHLAADSSPRAAVVIRDLVSLEKVFVGLNLRQKIVSDAIVSAHRIFPGEGAKDE